MLHHRILYVTLYFKYFPRGYCNLNYNFAKRLFALIALLCINFAMLELVNFMSGTKFNTRIP